MGQFELLGRVMDARSVLRLQCGHCGHSAALSRAEAFARFGAHASPFEVRRRARCSACQVQGKVGASVS